MTKRRLRLIAFTGLVLVALGGALVWLEPDASSDFAPGPLARVHAGLEGDERCGECHVARGGLDRERCLACHTPLARRIAAGAGFHAKAQGECQDCHAEHRGVEYDPVRWPPPEAPFAPTQAGQATAADFPHEEATGHALRGAHAEGDCTRCHTESLVADAELLAFKAGHPTYLGLGSACGDCHADPHRPSLGAACQGCHGEERWAPAAGFDHDRTRFPLAGKHQQAGCEGCHRDPPGPPSLPTSPVPTFQPRITLSLPRPFRGGFGTVRPVASGARPACGDCHADPHRWQGKLAALGCADCHTPASWGLAEQTSFDHAATGFELAGGHARATCASCHGPKLDRPLSAACASCHEDRHRGAFAREMARDRAGCAACHGVEAWKPATFATERHSLPLVAGHAVACERCHADERFARLPAAPPDAVGPLDASCQACHADPHAGKLSADCASCHGLESFHLAKLDAAGHERLGFPIVGAHRRASCEGCHGGRSPEGGLRRRALSEVAQAGCAACHEDRHQGQLGADCASCHGQTHFVPSTYDEARHARARLPLEDAHRAVPCEVCHVRDLPGEAQRFRWGEPGGSVACDACHTDPHLGQFGRTGCGDCHGAHRFAPIDFDVPGSHVDWGFPLEGPHDAACGRCHVTGLAHGDAVTYRGTPQRCGGCHDDPHLGQFAGRDGSCRGCHLPAAWSPTTFDHERSRFPLRGAHAALECTACHLVSEVAPGGATRRVIHYYPLEERRCADCHANPHTRERR